MEALIMLAVGFCCGGVLVAYYEEWRYRLLREAAAQIIADGRERLARDGWR